MVSTKLTTVVRYGTRIQEKSVFLSIHPILHGVLSVHLFMSSVPEWSSFYNGGAWWLQGE